MSDYTVCPRCEQGRVETYRVRKTGDLFQLCDECDAVWSPGIEPNLTQFGTFDTFMLVRGLSDVWDEIDEVVET
ncbi:hypothetical protein EU811_17560 [Arthrobacter sp. TS-15]|uniref:hypothetical protein n=1 Tax=Arthrobacter sp. TS-15 TaxID=2510797 RepID=UPI00115CDD76|nr:hypothetical protein [Arthrobacter sp. TS-15]TQS90651.1 hypothetical protein EU811_17560 [Arthrobacter sp. TS-15]